MARALVSIVGALVATLVLGREISAQHSGPPRPRSAAAEKILAAERGDTPEVRALVTGSDPNARDQPRQRTALMWTIRLNDRAAFDRLLAVATDVNVVDGQGQTALYHAAELAMAHDTSAIVEALIAKGADVSGGVRGTGMTPLMHAANANAAGVARAILSKLDAKSIDASTTDGITALIAAASVGARDVAYLLLEKGASIDLADLQGKTPLMYAAGRRFPGTTDTVKVLLDMGANPSARDKDGHTALSEAEQRGSADVVALLKKAGAQ